MDKKSAMRRAKRQSKVLEDNFWDCSVCTYRNTAEAFKCLMCDVRKGTSTRKPRLNQAVVAQQVVAVAGSNSSGPTGSSDANKSKKIKGASGSRSSSSQRSRGPRRPARLRDIDRSSGQEREVTVNSVTVVITEYKRRTPQHNITDNEDSSDTRP